MARRAAIIAVGSELLSGQIVNRNAAWISERLFALGLDPKLHLTVDDVEAEIVDGLAQAGRVADLIFVTGGLGPTADDLTRNAVADWSGNALAFDAPSWEHITRIFARFSNTVPETNRQQCYFPAGAKVLTNNAGTANAFALSAHGKEIWVLPGPPREVEAVWTDHIQATLAAGVPASERQRLRRWRTIGRGESHLAEIVEPLLQGVRDAGASVAYRAHQPYIELKLRFPESAAARFAPVCEHLHAALRPWLYETDDEDHAAALAQRLSKAGAVDLYDGATHGHVAELLSPYLRDRLTHAAPLSLVTSFEAHDAPAAFVEQAFAMNADAGVALAVAGYDASGTWAVGLRRGDATSLDERPSLYKGETMWPRNLRAVAYLAVKAWLDMLTGSEH